METSIVQCRENCEQKNVVNLETENSTETELKSPVDANVDIHMQKCKDHTHENLSFYCEKHNVCICGRCFRLNHISCSDLVVDLNDVMHDSEPANKSVSTLQMLGEEIDRIVEEIDENRRLNDKWRSNFTNGINEYHGALVLQLKMLMTKAEKESDNLHKQNTDVLDETVLKCKEHKQALQQQMEYLDKLEHTKHYRSLFVALKRMEKNIDSLKDKNVKCRHENNIKEYEFVRNLKLTKLIEEEDHIGTLTIACDGSEEVIEIFEEKAVAVTDEFTGDEQNEEKTSDEKENAKGDRYEHEQLQGIQRQYDEKLERLKELEDCIQKREETHRQNVIQIDEQLKCLQEKEMTISKQEKNFNFEKEKWECIKRVYEQKINKLHEQEKRINLEKEKYEINMKRDYGKKIEALAASEKKIQQLQEQEKRIHLENQKYEKSMKREYEKRIEKLQEELAISEQKIKQLQEKEKRINLKKEKCESMNREYEQFITTLQEGLAVSEQKMKELQEQGQSIHLEKEKYETSMKREYDKKIEKLQEELVISKQKIKQLQETEKRINFENEKCKSMKLEYEQFITKLQADLAVSVQQIKKLQDEDAVSVQKIKKLQDELAVSVQQIKKLQAELAVSVQQIKKQQDEWAVSVQHIRKLQEELAVSEQKIKQLQEQEKRINLEKGKCERLRLEYEQWIKKLQEEWAVSVQQTKKLQDELTVSEQEVKQLQEQEKRIHFENYFEIMRREDEKKLIQKLQEEFAVSEFAITKLDGAFAAGLLCMSFFCCLLFFIYYFISNKRRGKAFEIFMDRLMLKSRGDKK